MLKAHTSLQSLRYHEGLHFTPHALSDSGRGRLQEPSLSLLPLPPMQITPLTWRPPQAAEQGDQSPGKLIKYIRIISKQECCKSGKVSFRFDNLENDFRLPILRTHLAE